MSILTQLNDRIKGTIPETSRDWMRIGLVLLVLLLSVMIGYGTRPLIMVYILAGVTGIPVIIALLRWPNLGIILVLATGLFLDITGPGGINATVIMVILLVGLWVVDQVVFKTEVRVVSSRIMTPLYGLIILSVLAFAMGQYPWFPYAQSAPLDAQAGGFALYVLSFLALLLTANQIKTVKELQQITWIFIGLSAFNVVGLIFPVSRQIVNTLVGTIGSVYWIWIVALLYGQILFNDSLKLRWRIVLGFVLAAALYVLFIQKFDNKSGWVPALLVLWLMTMLRSWKLGSFLTLVGLAGLVVIYPQVVDSESYSLSTRLEILPILWQITLANPVFGVGFANYYFYAQQFSVRGWYVTINSHNNYVDVVAQIGLLGIIFFGWFFLQISTLAWSLFHRVKSGFERAYVAASLGAILGMLAVMGLGDWVLPFAYNIGLNGFRSSVMGWVFMGGLVVLEQLVNQREREEHEALPEPV